MCMTDINPISNQDDILREANANAPQPITTPVTPVVQEQPEYYSLQVDPLNQSAAPQPDVRPIVEIQPLPVQTPEVVVVPKIPVEINNEKSFRYRLPMMSYVLTWFYGLLALLLIILMASAINNLVGLKPSYSSAILADQQGQYTVALAVYGAIFISVTCLIYALLSGKRLFRYIAIGVACMAMGFELYKAIPLFNSMSGSYGGAFIGLYIIMYLPYIFLPLLTIVYLFTPKAQSAYR